MSDSEEVKDPLMTWFLIPWRDENYQWWHGYQKVRMVKLPESEKQKFLDSLKNFKKDEE